MRSARINRFAAALAAALALAGCGGQNEAASDTADAVDAVDTADASAMPGASGPPAPAEPVFCAAVGASLPPAKCAEAERISAAVKEGAASANVPAEMTRGVAARVTLAIGQKADTGQVQDVTADLPGADYSYVLPVGTRMTAELRGVGFTFKPISPATQSVTARGPTTWDWEVTPTQAGSLTLTVQTSAVYEGAGPAVPLANSIKSYPVTVRVAPGDRAKDVMGGLPSWLNSTTEIVTAAAALVAALGGLLLAIRQLRKGKGDPPTP